MNNVEPNLTPNLFRVKAPDGRIWKIPESGIDAVTARGGIVIEDSDINNIEPSLGQPQNNIQSEPQLQNDPSSKMVRMKAPDGRIWKIPEQSVEKAKSRGAVLEPEQLSTTDRLLQLGEGFANIPATGADLTNQFIAAPVLNAVGGAVELGGKAVGLVSDQAGEAIQNTAKDIYKARDFYKDSNVSKQTQSQFNQLAGKDISPKDTIGKILHSTGQVSFPLSNVVKGAKTAVEGVKAVAKHVGTALGGAIALEKGKDYKFFHNDSLGGHIEDFLHTVVGMTLADKGMSRAKKLIVEDINKNLVNLIKEEGVVETAKQGITNVGGKVVSIWSKPNKELVSFAKEEGITLPFQVALGGRFNEFLSNTFLKSLFVKKTYKDVIEKADGDMINAVKSKINQIHPEEITGEIASSRARSHLESEESLINDNVKKLYNQADSNLTGNESILPEDVVKYVTSILKREELNVPSPGPKAKKLADYLKEIGEGWGFILPKNTLEEFKDSPEFLKKVIEEFAKNPKEVPIKEMIGQLKATYERTKYERNIPGIENLYNGLIGALQKDIGKSTNQAFVKDLRVANEYFKLNKVDRIRTDMAQSLMNGEIPKEAYRYMGSKKEIKFLQKIMGDSEAAKEVMSSLKRAKLEDVLTSNILDNSGTISYAALSNMFINNPEKQSLLKELLGEQYQGMARLAKISQGFVKSGKSFGNSSGTTLSARDVSGLQDIFKNLAGVVGVGAATGQWLPAPAAIWATSYLLSNKRFVNTALKYAQASSAKDKIVLSGRLSSVSRDILDKVGEKPQSLLSLIK